MSGTSNPLFSFVEDRILSTLLKSGSTTSYYTALNINNLSKYQRNRLDTGAKVKHTAKNV